MQNHYKIVEYRPTELKVTVILEGDLSDGDYVNTVSTLPLARFDSIVTELTELLRITSIYPCINDGSCPLEISRKYYALIDTLEEDINFPYGCDYEPCHSLGVEDIFYIDETGKHYKINLWF